MLLKDDRCSQLYRARNTKNAGQNIWRRSHHHLSLTELHLQVKELAPGQNEGAAPGPSQTNPVMHVGFSPLLPALLRTGRRRNDEMPLAPSSRRSTQVPPSHTAHALPQPLFEAPKPAQDAMRVQERYSLRQDKLHRPEREADNVPRDDLVWRMVQEVISRYKLGPQRAGVEAHLEYAVKTDHSSRPKTKIAVRACRTARSAGETTTALLVFASAALRSSVRA